MPVLSPPVTRKRNIANKDAQKVLGLMAQILMSSGARVERPEPSRISFQTPRLNSNRQNPLHYLGKGSARILSTGSLEVSADLSGIRGLQKFLLYFPVLLGAFLIILFGALGYFLNPGLYFGAGVTVLALSPWLILSPLLAGKFHKKAEMALEDLVSNAIENS